MRTKLTSYKASTVNATASKNLVVPSIVRVKLKGPGGFSNVIVEDWQEVIEESKVERTR